MINKGNMKEKKLYKDRNKNSISPIKVTLINQFFSPDYAATGQLLNQLTKLLEKKKISFLILTGIPSYTFNVKKYKKHEIKINKKIVRFSSPFLGKKGLKWRSINGLIYSIKVFISLLKKENRGDLIICTSEPPFFVFFMSLIYFLFRVPYLFLIYDLHPDTLVNLNFLTDKNLFIRVWHNYNKYCFNNSKNVIVLSELMKEKCILNYGEELKNKITVIPSWSDINKIKPLSKEKNNFIKKNNLYGKFIILYSGNQGRMHDLKTIIYSANYLKEDNQILFLFIGDGPMNYKVREMKNTLSLDNVIFFPYQPFEELPHSLTSGDIALVSTLEEATYLVAPSKLYGHLASGTPIALISSKNSYIKSIIEKNNCGKWFKNGDFKSLSSWILNLKNDPKLRNNFSVSARKLSEEISNPDDIANKYYEAIVNAVN